MKKVILFSFIMLFIVALKINVYSQNIISLPVKSETQNIAQLKEPLSQEYLISLGTLTFTTTQDGDSLPIPVGKVRSTEKSLTTSDGGTATFIEFKTNDQNIETNQEETEIKVYPNPATNEFTIFSVNSAFFNSQIELMNLLGEKVIVQALHNNTNKATICVEDIENGIYFYRINFNGTIKNGKILILK